MYGDIQKLEHAKNEPETLQNFCCDCRQFNVHENLPNVSQLLLEKSLFFTFFLFELSH